MAETEQQSVWRREFEAMSPVERWLMSLPSPAQVVPSDKSVYFRALLAEADANKRDAREEATLLRADRANRIAWIAIAIAAASTIKDIIALIFK